MPLASMENVTSICGARRSSDPGELESAELLVLPRHRALALQNVDIDRGLEARRGCENLTFADGKGRVALNDPCADTAEGFDAERQRRDVQ